ncbi:unnamed protein product [Hydatigera taeniaeformis]|uniref:Histone H2A n=1 Tax=Hydatigena taeniaeformis TaxID=6205 RepID=A0A0R3WNV2_HYDTA|nr:unnamed protein product [Hydatigera taeniaeformis]
MGPLNQSEHPLLLLLPPPPPTICPHMGYNDAIPSSKPVMYFAFLMAVAARLEILYARPESRDSRSNRSIAYFCRQSRDEWRGKRGKSRAKSKTRSSWAGLQFPMGQVHRLLRRGDYAKRVGAGAPVHMVAVLEYLAPEVVDLADNAVRDNKKTHITRATIRKDEKLRKLMDGITIGQSCMLPHIQAVLMSQKEEKPVASKE